MYAGRSWRDAKQWQVDHVPLLSGYSIFSRNKEKLLGTTNTLIMLGCFNVICNAGIGYFDRLLIGRLLRGGENRASII